MKRREKVNYGWYHVNIIMIDGLIGLLGVFSIILAVVVKGIIGLILLNCGIIGLVFFSWPALGLLFINLIAKTGKAHPSVNEEQINSIPNPMILDIGCGSGRVAIKLAKQLKNGGQVHGIDIFNNAIKGNSLEKVQRNAEIEGVADKTAFQFGAATNIPYNDNSFDIINMSYVFHEIPDKNKAIREIKRVLKTNGIFCLTEFHRNSLGAILINGLYTFMFKSHKYWLKLFKENDLKIQEYRRKPAIGTFFLKLK